jgi:hypothetical protein
MSISSGITSAAEMEGTLKAAYLQFLNHRTRVNWNHFRDLLLEYQKGSWAQTRQIDLLTLLVNPTIKTLPGLTCGALLADQAYSNDSWTPDTWGDKQFHITSFSITISWPIADEPFIQYHEGLRVYLRWIDLTTSTYNMLHQWDVYRAFDYNGIYWQAAVSLPGSCNYIIPDHSELIVSIANGSGKALDSGEAYCQGWIQ